MSGAFLIPKYAIKAAGGRFYVCIASARNISYYVNVGYKVWDKLGGKL